MALRALVIGGSGFIGKHLIRSLVAERRYERIISLDLKHPAEKLKGVEYYIADCTELIDVSYADSNTVIFHLAAHRTYPGFSDAEYFRTNVGTSRQVLNLAERAGVRTILFTSTMSVYSPGDDERLESSALAPKNAYGASKWQSEILHSEWLTNHTDNRLVVCRPAVIFGHGDNGNFTRLARALQRQYFVYVERRNTIKSNGYVTDLVKSFRFSIDRCEKQVVYNFSYPYRYTIEEIVETMCEVGGFRKPSLMVPASLLNAASIPFEVFNRLGFTNSINRERIQKLYQATNIIPKWLTDNGFQFDTELKTALSLWREESGKDIFI